MMNHIALGAITKRLCANLWINWVEQMFWDFCFHYSPN